MLLFSGLTYFPIKQTAAQPQQPLVASPPPFPRSQQQSQFGGLGFQQQRGPAFLVRLDSITADDTRSPRTDTVYVGVSGRVGTGGQPLTATRFLGDLGPHTSRGIGITVGPFDVSGNQMLSFSYLVENKGGGGVSQTLIDMGKGASALIFSPGVAGGVLAGERIIKSYAGGLLPGGCNGIVASDEIVFSKAQLQQMTASGPHTETRNYPGTDSPIGCGSNSNYHVTWTVMRTQLQPLQPGQVLPQTSNPIVREHRTTPSSPP